MRGVYLLVGAAAGFAGGNLALHLLGLPTASVDLRKIPAPALCAALTTGGVILVDHLYGNSPKETHPCQD